MKPLTPEQRQTGYILGDKGDYLDEVIEEAIITAYNTEGGGGGYLDDEEWRRRKNY